MSLRPGADPSLGDHMTPIIFLAGAVAHWWDERWDTPEHWEYKQWREEVRIALIAGGYLTYAHYEAFKGSWNPAAQKINEFALANSNLMVVMTPEHIPSPGTDDEIAAAECWGIPWVRITSSHGVARILPMVAEALS